MDPPDVDRRRFGSRSRLYRLLLSDFPIAAGVYPLKREDWPAEGVRPAPPGATSVSFTPATPSTPARRAIRMSA